MENTKLQQEDTVSADRKERIIFDQNTGKSRKISSVVSRQNFNNKKYGNRNSPIEFVTGKEPPPDVNADEDKKLKKESMSIISKILEAKSKKKKEEHCEEVEPVDTELTEQLQEVLAADAMAGDWIHDFVHSDNPKFEGKSKKERIKMALGAYYAKQRNEELEIEANHVAEACKTIAKAASKKKDDVPFDGPYTKTPANVVDKSGAVHTPMSRVRNLARQAMKQQTNEELETQLEGADMLSFTEFVGQLNEYNSKDGVYRHKGTYGGAYVDPEGADDADDKPKVAPAPAVKKGRGRPAGSYGTYKARSAETKAAAAAKSAASKAANKAK